MSKSAAPMDVSEPDASRVLSDAEELAMLDEAPEHFICPISGFVMEYPFCTEAGHSYEYHHIQLWLQDADKDPNTNQKLSSKTLVPNHNLRSQIQDWFSKNPKFAALRTKHVVPKPPPKAYELPSADRDQILKYQGKTERGGAKKSLAQQTETQHSAQGRTYSVCLKTKASTTILISRPQKELTIGLKESSTVSMPKSSFFATPKGIMFYDPKETCETRVLAGTDVAPACKFGTKCTNQGCKFAHPFMCFHGLGCTRRSTCKFYHPDPGSATTETVTRRACRYGTACTNKGCLFAHPRGRGTVPCTKARLLLTHSLELAPLGEEGAVDLGLTLSDETTCFQVSGEFVFSFCAYVGTWAKRHYRAVTVHRFDAQTMTYRVIGEYSLAGHYCNCVRAAGRYLVFSWWPYEDEAMRAVWEQVRITRKFEKELRAKDKTIGQLNLKVKELSGSITQLSSNVRFLSAQNSILQAQNSQFQAQNSQLQAQNSQLQTQNSKLQAEREAIAVEKAFEARERERLQRQLEWERNERLRARDPILIFALEQDKTGWIQDDWKLVLDYHKGAHDISLTPPLVDDSQQVSFTVNQITVHFELVVPRNIGAMKTKLPVQPKALCPDF